MRTKNAILVVILAMLLATGAAAQTDTNAKVTALPDDLLALVNQAENTWLEHLQASPVIFVMEMPKDSEAMTQADRWRFHVVELRDKAKSNRAWHEYWSQQTDHAGKLIPLYENAGAFAAKNDLAKDAQRYQHRLQTIKDWQNLCKDKMANQDSYLKAIDQEKDAYEKRLDAASQAQAEAKAGAAQAGPKTGAEEDDGSWFAEATGGTPYAQHEAVKEQLERQLFLQEQKRDAARFDGELAESLMGASEVVLQAKQADLKLAQRENALVDRQINASNGDKAWRKTWQAIAEKTRAKLPVLETVIRNQKIRVSQLKNEKAYFEAMVDIKNGRVKGIGVQIKQHEKKIYRALLLTAGDIVLRKGILVLAFLFGAWLAIRFVRLVGRWVLKRASDDDDATHSEREKTADTLVNVFAGVARLAIWLVVGLLILDALGVNISPLLGAFAIFGLAISFGSQNLVRDVVTGLFILLENQVSVGDVIEAGGKSGTVEKISLRRVVLRDIYGTMHNIPHGQIATLSNMTQLWARAVVHIGVAYDTDLRKVYELFNDVGQAMFAEPTWQGKMLEPPVAVGVTAMGDSAISIRLWAKVQPGSQWEVERELYVRLHEACRKHSIEIPFPQRVIEIKNTTVEQATET
ncbi:MAG: mechanosensitive ion channel family protein [Candidatus Lernaella stagnicola]|nr:mechanosensitive ion channel family protein [Candidatus Lernaella stagnicola]